MGKRSNAAGCRIPGRHEVPAASGRLPDSAATAESKGRRRGQKRKAVAKMPKSLNLVITEDSEVGGYTMECPQMPGCVTEADTLDELYRNWAEASSLWLAGARDDMAAGRDPFHPQLPGICGSAFA